MSQNKAALLMMKGSLSECTEEEQNQVAMAKKAIEDTMAEHEEGAAVMALAIISVELAIKNE